MVAKKYSYISWSNAIEAYTIVGSQGEQKFHDRKVARLGCNEQRSETSCCSKVDVSSPGQQQLHRREVILSNNAQWSKTLC